MAEKVSGSVLLEEVNVDALSYLQRYLRGGVQADDPSVREKARISAAVLANYTRQQQTQGARLVANTSLAALLAAGNQDDLHAYLRAAMPKHPMVQAIPVRQLAAEGTK